MVSRHDEGGGKVKRKVGEKERQAGAELCQAHAQVD